MADTTPLTSVIPENVPVGADQFPVVAFPVSVPETTIEPFPQTDCVVGFTTTPVNELMFRYLLGVVIEADPHGFTAVAITS